MCVLGKDIQSGGRRRSLSREALRVIDSSRKGDINSVPLGLEAWRVDEWATRQEAPGSRGCAGHCEKLGLRAPGTGQRESRVSCRLRRVCVCVCVCVCLRERDRQR